MLWNYLQQITFHLHSSITKYIVKTFVIFVAHLQVLGLCPVTQSFFSFGTFLSDWIARFWKYCLIHSRLRTVFFFLSFFFLVWYQLCATRQIQVWAKLGTLMGIKGPTWKRGVCYGATKTVCLYAKQKRPSLLKGSMPLRTDCRQHQLARVHNNCGHSDSEKNKLLYASFLWQSPKKVMQATKIDFKNERQTIWLMQLCSIMIRIQCRHCV